jgi:hypothetical protein
MRPNAATVAKRTCFIVYILIVSGCAGGIVSKGRSISGSWASGVSANQPIVWVSSIGFAWSVRRMNRCFELHQALVRWRDQGAANHSDNQGDSGDQEDSHHAVDDSGATAFIPSPPGQLRERGRKPQ